jgi:hypothetical protein
MTAKKKAASTAGKKNSSSKSRGQRGAETRTGTEPPKGSVADHSEHPESPGDSTVRHADNPVGRRSAGSRGFPQGEYDVTEPAKKGATKKDPTQLAIEQGLTAEQLETIKAAQKHPNANRLKPEQRALAVEALPVGAVIEKEGDFRWRVRSAGTNGGNRFGHGKTAQEAIDNYILGHSVITTEQAGAEQFHSYPKSVQKEIEERDAAVAKRQGRNVEDFPEVIARREFVKNQKAAKGAKPTAPGQTSDGAEVASAQLEAGAKRGQAAQNRSSARRRTGGKARK